MKRLFFILVIFFSQLSISQNCETCISIPDEVFEGKLIALGIDTNGFTGDILTSDTVGVTELDLSTPLGSPTTEKITNTSGIEAFSELEILDLSNNRVENAFFVSSLSAIRVLNLNNNDLGKKLKKCLSP